VITYAELPGPTSGQVYTLTEETGFTSKGGHLTYELTTASDGNEVVKTYIDTFTSNGGTITDVVSPTIGGGVTTYS